jgi:predicted Na+-dependent transporter
VALAALAALALNVAATAVSFSAARLARLGDRRATTIAMELGVHNSTPTIAVASGIDRSWRSRPPSTAPSCSSPRARSRA